MPPLSAELNWSATTGIAELILEGDYHNKELNTITQLLLDNCTRVTDLDILKPTIMEQQLKQKYIKWRESTATSPSGRHLGHWKALWKQPSQDLDDMETANFYQAQQAIRTLYMNMINYAVKHKYSYGGWRQVINNMIYKEPGNTKVHRLRVIHIYMNWILTFCRD